MKITKAKKCKQCNTYFYPRNKIQVVCAIKCSIEYSNTKIKKEALKKARIDKRELKESLMTKTNWKQKLQTVFNTFIRKRDFDMGCVSCETPLQNRKFDAGHYYPTTYDRLRFDERNVHGQCVPCNKNKHSNTHEYRKRILNRITKEDLDWLDDNRLNKLDLSIPELKELIKIYKQKVKAF